MTDPPRAEGFAIGLAEARRKMADLVAANPGDTWLLSIQRQLDAVAGWTRGGQWPERAQVEKLSFGVLASRSVDELDPELAQLLYRLAGELDRG